MNKTKKSNWVKAYKDNSQEHLVIMSENFVAHTTPYIRTNSECLTGDALGSLKCNLMWLH